jgi:hypothetical protein
MNDVNICHGSKKRKETKNHRTYVESIDKINVEKTSSWNRSVIWNPFFTSDWTDLTVRNMEANMR